ncbi:HNH endonuclease signature motif containing protein [Paludisphaera sp.]|uniref:HNH endonuclease n=1 Tax=Paludisphaera sp. TaxID=2017432 RepID=UPI00301E5489
MPSKIPYHKPPGASASRHRDYDRTRRDGESKAFYNSKAWRSVRAMKLRRSPLCELCSQAKPRRLTPGTHVHHVVELRDAPDLGLVVENLQTLCHGCHSRLHASRRA